MFVEGEISAGGMRRYRNRGNFGKIIVFDASAVKLSDYNLLLIDVMLHSKDVSNYLGLLVDFGLTYLKLVVIVKGPRI